MIYCKQLHHAYVIMVQFVPIISATSGEIACLRAGCEVNDLKRLEDPMSTQTWI